ncbi:MAG: AraC family transcriptional regulator [Spirochaetia bacterium]|nr:AraC family transcriptional regulator [Spirochaetia bacterium]
MMIAGANYLLSFLILLNSLLYILKLSHPRNMISFLILFVLSIHAFLDGSFHSADMHSFPFFLGISPLITSILFFLFILYLNVVINLEIKWKHIYLLLIGYILVETVLYVLFLFDNAGQYGTTYKSVLQKGSSIFFYHDESFYLQWFFLLFVYSYAIVFGLKKLIHYRIEKKSKFKYFITFSVFIILIVFLAGGHIYNFIRYQNSEMHAGPGHKLHMILIVWLGLIYLQIWPNFYKNKYSYFDMKTFGIRPYSVSSLDQVKEELIQIKLNDLVAEEKIYKVEDLSLPMLAAAIGISPHQMSEYLNKNEGKSFFKYINAMRIEEAKKLLMNDQLTISQICYEVGFNTSATFYSAFKDKTGYSPSRWRKKQLDFVTSLKKEASNKSG